MDFDNLIAGINEGITLEEASLLRTLASQVFEGCIVEIGSFQGKSAVALAMGVREQTSAQRPPIYCIEPHRPFTGFYDGKFGSQNRGVFYEVMGRTGAFNEVALINLSSENVAPMWEEPVGLLFIDGDHSYEGVKRDFEYWSPHLVPGSIIAFDDALDPACGPHRLLCEILKTGHYRRIAGAGKVAVLEKTSYALPLKMPGCPQRILVACHNLVISGGLLRFERLGIILKSWGHEVTFVILADEPVNERHSALPVLSMEEAAARQWHAVMVPGAGFPEDTIEKFALFRQKNFGIRVQHILNDQSVRPRFKQVNHFFEPHVIIFNNLHWQLGSFTDFQANCFHTLLGAVDLQIFRPRPYRSHPLAADKWIIGGQAAKNPEPLLEALAHLPSTVIVRLFGPDRREIEKSYGSLIAAGRLEMAGQLEDEEVAQFYREVDCVVMTETLAGWANMVAEAMASGVPVICTPHGTVAFARHAETALVMQTPDPVAIAESVLQLMNGPALCQRLAEGAQKAIAAYAWEPYAQKMLRLIRHDGYQHYFYAPELGLYGKWSIEERLSGLASLLERAGGMDVIDFGAAEGIVAREFLKNGAARVHGFELAAHRVNIANALCAAWPGSEFRVADLSDWHAFHRANANLLEDNYDIVLYLGIQQHLPQDRRLTTLKHAVQLTRRYFAIRTPESMYELDRIDELLEEAGLYLLVMAQGTGHRGGVKIFARERVERKIAS